MKAIVIGATGLTGGHLIDELIADETCHEIRVFTRRSIAQKSPKIKEFIVDMFALEEHKEDFIGDVVYCCIGTTKKKTPDPAVYEMIDYGMPVQAAKLTKANDIDAFIVISSLGADEDSKVMYSRLKGRMEKDILDLKILNTYILRPSLIVGDRKEKRLGEDMAKIVMTVFDFLIPQKYKRIEAKTIAKAMHKLFYYPYARAKINSDEIKTIVSKL